MAEAPEYEELIGRLEDCTHNAHVLSICTEAATAIRARAGAAVEVRGTGDE